MDNSIIGNQYGVVTFESYMKSITSQGQGCQPFEFNYDNTVTNADVTDIEAATAIITISESKGLLDDVLINYSNTNTGKSSEYLSYKPIKHITSKRGAQAREKPYKCYECEKSFVQKNYLHTHMKIHTREKCYSCPVCQKSFIQKGNLKHHIVRNHPSEGDLLPHFACSECDFKCAYKSTLANHKLTHTAIKKRKCNECGKKFKRKVNLIKHIHGVHTGEKPFNCSYCDGTFFIKRDLILHERLAHTGETSFLCNICNKSFVMKYLLDSHVKTMHKAKRDYSCMVCSYVGRSERALELHIINRHPDEKPQKEVKQEG